MADIVVDTYKLRRYAERLSKVDYRIEYLEARLDRLYNEVGLLGLWNLVRVNALTGYCRRLKNCRSYLGQTASDFENAERTLLGLDPARFEADKKSSKSAGVSYNTGSTSFADEFRKNFGWKEALSGAGYIGTIYDLADDIKSDIKEGKTWKDFLRSGAKNGVKTYQFLSGAVKTYKNYKKIGNAVGTKTAMTWWAKNITGWKPLGRASTAKSVVARFKNNLTNKTSPFNAQFKDIVKDFKGGNGVGKAVASWASVATTGVLNWLDNKEEQKNSNGTMSDGRVIAETITETVVDTTLTYGASIVVGAAVTAVIGPVAAPGILVVAASGVVLAGINAGVKAITGKTTTEWISDGILDTGKAVGKAVSKAAKTVGKWFKKLSFV